MQRLKAIIFALSLFFCPLTYSQTQEQLYQQVFGEKTKPQQTSLPLFDGPFFLSDVRTKLSRQSILSFHKKDLVIALREVLKDRAYEELLSLEGENITPKELGKVLIEYDPVKLQLNLKAPASLKRSRKLSLGDGPGAPRQTSHALDPAPLSGAMTIRAEQTQSSEGLGPSFFQTQLDSFIHYKGLVIENQSNYQTRYDQKWFRGDTRLIKDFPDQNIRWQAGDIQNQSIGDLSFQRVGGLSFSRNFQLDPYRTNLPFGSQEFTIESRSRVNTYVNGSLIKSEVLPAGSYNISDIPLNNGLNRITVETENELGRKEVFEFQQSSSLQLLNPGESKFDLTVGHAFEDRERMRKYLDDEPLVASGFYQYGFNAKQTLGLYAQQVGDFNQQGVEYNHASAWGIFSIGGARGANSETQGAYASFSYQLTQMGKNWSDAYQIALQYDYRDKNYQTTEELTSNLVASNLRAQLSIPLIQGLTASLGHRFSDMRDGLHHRLSHELGLNTRLGSGISLSLFASRNRDEFKNWSSQAYAFLTYSLPNKSQYAQALYNSQNNSTRLTLNSDNQNELNTFRSQASLENNDTSQEASLNMTYQAAYADVGLRGRLRHQREIHEEQSLGSLSLGSSFVFVADDEHLKADFTRPLNNSFAFFTTEDDETPVELRSTAIYNESAKGPFGHTVYTNLIPYQYREVRLDSVKLPPGQSYNQESFLLHPAYKSGHLIEAKIDGKVSFRAVLLDHRGKKLPLSTGHLVKENEPAQKVAFFTNREGKVFINGLKEGRYIVKVEAKNLETAVSVQLSREAVQDLGRLQLKKGSSDD